MRTCAVAICLLSVSAEAAAHPGHGPDAPPGLLHYLTDPWHLLPALAILGLLAVLRRRLAQRHDAG